MLFFFFLSSLKEYVFVSIYLKQTDFVCAHTESKYSAWDMKK